MTTIVTYTPNPALDITTATERVMPTHKLRCGASRCDPGGGGINVARVVRRLGGEVTAVYPRGGVTGALFDSLLARENIVCKTSDLAEDTRQNLAVNETTSGDQFRFVLPGPTLTEPEWRSSLDALATCADHASYMVASGSLPLGAPIDLYARASRVAKAGNTKFLLDSSGHALKAALAEGVFLVKPSLRELCEIVGETLEDEVAWRHACASLVKDGRAEIVALTLGPLGALLVTSDQALFAEPLPIKAQGSSGAGDSFLGAMVFSLAEGRDLIDALRLGVAAGSSAVNNPGTELAHADDTRRLMEAVVIREL